MTKSNEQNKEQTVQAFYFSQCNGKNEGDKGAAVGL